jgi:hypothetical protein
VTYVAEESGLGFKSVFVVADGVVLISPPFQVGDTSFYPIEILIFHRLVRKPIPFMQLLRGRSARNLKTFGYAHT